MIDFNIGDIYLSDLFQYKSGDKRGQIACMIKGRLLRVRWAKVKAEGETVQSEELLASLGPEVDLICRERISYAYVSGAVRSAGCHLADDMALSARKPNRSSDPRSPRKSRAAV